MKKTAAPAFIKDHGIFSAEQIVKDGFRFSVEYTLAVEAFILTAAGNKFPDMAIASLGSFSRRELSPKSDIDIMFIAADPAKYEDQIRELITYLWDN